MNISFHNYELRRTPFLTFAQALAYVVAPKPVRKRTPFIRYTPEITITGLPPTWRKDQCVIPVSLPKANPIIGKTIGKGSCLNGYQISNIFTRWDIEWATLTRGMRGDMLHRKVSVVKDLF